jgi:hypothetical protein
MDLLGAYSDEDGSDAELEAKPPPRLAPQIALPAPQLPNPFAPASSTLIPMGLPNPFAPAAPG